MLHNNMKVVPTNDITADLNITSPYLKKIIFVSENGPFIISEGRFNVKWKIFCSVI